MPRVVIAGGGVIGCATAYYLARGGADVTVIERGDLGSESSSAAAGMLAPLSDEGADRGPDFQALSLDSFALYDTLLDELAETGIDLRYTRSGVLHLALADHEAAALRHRMDAQQHLAPDNRFLTGDDLRAAEPQASPAAVAGLLSPSEHYLDPKRLVLALAEASRRLGVRFLTGTAVTSLLRKNGSPTGVRAGGAVFTADAVLLAGGAWTARLARSIGVNVPVYPVRGQMLSLRGPAEPLRRIIWGERAYLLPREDGQTFVGATVEDVGFRKRTTGSGLAQLRRTAAELVPTLASATVVNHWVGLRPASPDGLPMLGRLPGFDNAWVATGHFRNGILLTPITGQLMAEGILAGTPPARLAPFSPDRFSLDS